MATFQARVESLSGAVSSTTELGTWLSDGVIDIMRRIALIDRNALIRFAQSGVVASTGLDLASRMDVLEVYRGTYPAYEIPAGMRWKATQSRSVHKATTKNPVYYKLNQKLYVKPNSASSAYASYVAPVTVAYGDTAISNFPNELEYLVVLYAVLQNLQGKISDVSLPADLVLPVPPIIGDFISRSETLPTWVSIVSPALPVAPSDADVDFSGIGSTPVFTAPSVLVLPVWEPLADLTISTLTLTTVPPVPVGDIDDGSITAFGTAPTYTIPVISMADVEPLAELTVPVPPIITDLDVSTVTAPTAPDAPSFSTPSITISAAVPTYTKPTVSMPSAPPIGALDLSGITPPSPPADPSFTAISIALGTAPDYTKPAPTPTMATLFTSVDTMNDTNHDPELAQVKVAEINAAVNDYNAALQNELNDFNEDLAIYQTTLQKNIEDAKTKLAKESGEYEAKLRKFASQVESYTAQINAAIQDYIAENTAYINVYSAEARADIDEYVANIQNELNEFNREQAVYRNEMELDIETAKLVLNEEIAEYNAKLGKYQFQVAAYSAEVNSLVSEYAALGQVKVNRYSAEVNASIQSWQAEEIQGKQNQWIQQRSSELKRYETDVQNALADFNRLNTAYQAAVQKNITEAANLQTRDKLRLDKYAAQLNEYQIKVNTEVQEYLQLVNSELTQWAQKRKDNMEKYQIGSANAIAKYTNELNLQSVEFDTDYKAWSTLIQQALQEYQAETGYDLGKYSAEVNAVVGKYQADIAASSAEFQAGIAKYSAELSYVNEYNQRILGKYTGEIGAYSAELQGAIGGLNARLARYQANIVTYRNQYVDFLERYERGINLGVADRVQRT